MFEKMREHRKVIRFFAVVYLVFSVALIYLLFYTPGLEFSMTETAEGGLDVFIENNSVHIINNIEIEGLPEEKVLEIKQLLPREKIKLDFGENSGAIHLSAKAPYHETVGADFTLWQPGEKIPNISYHLIIPELVLVGTPFNAEIEVCNDDEETIESMEFEQRHGTEFFAEEKSVQVLSLAARDCENLIFSLTPINEGTTTIYFNVKAQSYSKQFSRQVEIVEFR